MNKNIMKSSPIITLLLLLLLSCHESTFSTVVCSANQQADLLLRLLKSQNLENLPGADLWEEPDVSPVYVGPQDGLMEADKIESLPGQPEGVDFDQYGGYVTIDPKTGKNLFYYFVESPQNSSSKPLVLWLNGGPGCSSLGFGAMEELGPFRVNSDGKTLFRNEYAWNEAANVIFLESPVGVGFSYSNTSSDYDTGDKKTTKDSHTFLINWLERFPQYKTRDFFITGESYAGHYVPQLAYTILSNNKITNQTIINLKGIAIGNAVIDYLTWIKGIYDYLWTHALNSDETHAAINKYCFLPGNYSSICDDYWRQSRTESGRINYYNIYAPLCDASAPKPATPGSVKEFDPCSGEYVESYLNTPEVQKALHAISTKWSACGGPRYDDASTQTVLPTVKRLIESGISIWIYSGDTDAVVPVTSSRYSVNALKLPVETSWRPWYSKKEVGGHVFGFKGVVLITVRGAGHTVPSFQPERSLQLISSFLQGNLPPSSSK